MPLWPRIIDQWFMPPSDPKVEPDTRVVQDIHVHVCRYCTAMATWMGQPAVLLVWLKFICATCLANDCWPSDTTSANILRPKAESNNRPGVCVHSGLNFAPGPKKKKIVANGVWLNGPKSLTHLHVLLVVWHFRFVLQSANLNSASEFASICSQNYVPQNGKEKEI